VDKEDCRKRAVSFGFLTAEVNGPAVPTIDLEFLDAFFHRLSLLITQLSVPVKNIETSRPL
jgi:hypothetical protein